jgi:predicted nucleotidyltransferase
MVDAAPPGAAIPALPSLPDHVAAVLEQLVRAAVSSAGSDLASIVLYGSAAEGRMRASSDVNLLFVFERGERASLDQLGQLVTTSRAAVRLAPMFITRSELPAAIDAFAQKFRDIEARHVVLHGSDPFVGLEVSRDALLRRLKQVLLNLTLRLREAYVEQRTFEERATRTVADSAGPLRTSAAAILELEKGAKLQPKEALEQLASVDGLASAGLLADISRAREEGRLEPGRAPTALFEVMQLAEKLFVRASRLE